MAVAALRQVLEQRFPTAVPVTQRTADSLATGIRALDLALPGGGFPRGRLSTWTPGSGATALLHAACRAAVSRGERSAWIDAAGVTAGAAWRDGPLLLRATGDQQALACAEELVWCGGFALTVLAGTPAADAERVRLVRAAREGGSALVVLSTEGFMASIRVRSWISPGSYQWTVNTLGEPVEVKSVGVRVRATALGWSRDAEVRLPVFCDDLRLLVEPGLADRRGAAR